MVKINSKQRDRLARIEVVKSVIKNVDPLKEVNYKGLLMEVISSLLVSERVAKEYIKIARYQLGED